MPSPDDVRSARREALGDAIRARRQILGLSQEQLADRAGIERKSVSRVETGAYSPSVDRLWSICDALGVLPQALFASSDSPPIDGAAGSKPGSATAPSDVQSDDVPTTG